MGKPDDWIIDLDIGILSDDRVHAGPSQQDPCIVPPGGARSYQVRKLRWCAMAPKAGLRDDVPRLVPIFVYDKPVLWGLDTEVVFCFCFVLSFRLRRVGTCSTYIQH